MSNTKTEAQRLADQLTKWANDYATTDDTDSMARQAAAELRRLDAVEQRHIEMMANPCPEWDGKAYMQAIDSLRAQLAKAVAEEREACALECESRQANGNRTHTHPDECASAIRARSNT